jgi:hypothetical protein
MKMRNQRLDNIIDDEIGRIIDRTKILFKSIVRLDGINREDSLTAMRKLLGLSGEKTSMEDTPEYDTTVKYNEALVSKKLCYTANLHALSVLDELTPSEDHDSYRKKIEAFRSVVDDSYDFPEHLIFEYLVKGKIKGVEDKLADYERTIADISADETLEDTPLFSRTIKDAYNRLKLDLRNLEAADQKFKSRAEEVHSINPRFSLEGPSEVGLIMGPEQVEKCYEMLKNIKTQELVIDALSRVYSRYRRGFD